MTFTSDSYASNGVTAGGTAETTSKTATSWTGTDTANSTDFTLNSSSDMRMTEFIVNYTYRTWE